MHTGRKSRYAARRIAKSIVEILESRKLLSVSASEYDAIRAMYPEFGLPADMAGVNLIEITPAQLGIASLKAAVAAAGTTSQPDLIVLRTSDTQNTIRYTSVTDTLAIDIPASSGATMLVGFGTQPLTLDAQGKARVLSVGSTNSTTQVCLGGLVITGAYSSTDGGGVLQTYGTLTMANVTIRQNTDASTGGGLYKWNGSLALRDVTISGNTANSGAGGGLFAEGGTTTMTNVTITRNTSHTYGGGISTSSSSKLTMTNVTISDNTTGQQGGGMYLGSGTTSMTGGAISGNAAAWGTGGGVYYDAWGTSSLALSGVQISGNSASYSGGGIYQKAGTLIVTSAVISGNAPGYGGGGVQVDNGTATLTNTLIAGNAGVGFGQSLGTSTLTNVTIGRNSAAGISLGGGTLDLRNTLVARNSTADGLDIFRSGGTLTGSYNLIGNGSGQTTLVNGTNGNLVGSAASPIDALLAEGAGPGTGMAPLVGSPSIDAGSSALLPADITTDIYGSARIQGATVNIGAVESALSPRPAVVYVVNSLDGSTAADGKLTLREALAAANENRAVGDAPAGSYSAADRITFAPGLAGTILTDGQVYAIQGSLDLVGSGSSALTLDAQGTSAVLRLTGAYPVTLSSITLTGGQNIVYGAAAGIYSGGGSLTLRDVVVRGNSATRGAGGIQQAGGTITMTDVVVAQNKGESGGGISLKASTSVLTNVRIVANSATSNGGGVYATGPAQLTNVVISDNISVSSGGGMYASSTTLTLSNITVVRNVSSSTGGGGLYEVGGTWTMNNSIIARNSATSDPDFTKYSGTLLGSYNLIGIGSPTGGPQGTGNRIGTTTSPLDPLLAEGAGYGTGAAPLPGSPVIDAGSSSLVPAGVSTDLYGSARIQGATVNIGAVETSVAPRTAVSYVVTSLQDRIATDGVLTFREALEAANRNEAVGDAPAGSHSDQDRITFAPGLAGILPAQGDPWTILGSVAVVGNGHDATIFDGGGATGVLQLGSYRVNLSGITIRNGRATRGAGIYALAANLALSDALVSGNITSDSGAGIYQLLGTATLTDVILSANTTTIASGGGLYQNYGTSFLTNVTVSGNTGAAAAGISQNYADSTLTNVRISGNTSRGVGGGIYQSYGKSTWNAVVITSNVAASGGGGAYLDHVSSTFSNVGVSGNRASQGAGISAGTATIKLANSTICGNMADSSGGGLYVSAGTWSLYNTVIARNVGGSSPDFYLSSGGTFTAMYNLIGDGSGQTKIVNGTSGNLVGTAASPIDPMLGEGVGAGTGFAPLPGSPVIDAGNNSLIPSGVTTDLHGNTRVQGARVNIGAVETMVLPKPAVTYVVASLQDSIAADGVLTFREALEAANRNEAVGDAPAGSHSDQDQITFAPGLSGILPTQGHTWVIDGTLAIIGNGPEATVFDGGGTTAVLQVGPYHVSLTGITLRNGYATQAAGLCAAGATLSLTDVTVDGNLAVSRAGGMYLYASTTSLANVTISRNGTTGTSYGGGIYQWLGSLTVERSFITGNTAQSQGGGIFLSEGTMTLVNTVIRANQSGQGAGILQQSGTSTITGVVLASNIATSNGGGMMLVGGTSTMTNSTVVRNSGNSEAGGLLVWSTFTLNNSIVAQNLAAATPDLRDTTGILAGGNNLIGDGSGQITLVDDTNGNMIGTAAHPLNPMLAEGIGYGTGFAPLPGSPVVDAGDDTLVPAGISTDLYGDVRIQGTHVNIGAVETAVSPKAGTIYIVTSLADSTAADGVLTFREALEAANRNEAVGDAPAGSYSDQDQITFAPGLAGILLTQGGPWILDGSVAIVGNGRDATVFDGRGLTGVFQVGAYTVSLSGITIRNGNTTLGGGIYAAGATLGLSDVTISGNSAGSGGGGIYQLSSTTTLVNTTIRDNSTAGPYGGGIYQSYGTSAFTDVTVSGNRTVATYYGGGGLYLSNASASLTGVTITGNTTGGSGGGIYEYKSDTTLTNVTISGNITRSSASGGGIYQDSSTSTLQNVVIRGNTASGGAGILQSSGTLVIWNAAIYGNVATSNGGGIYQYNGTLSLGNVTIGGNTATTGGGIYLMPTALTLLNVIIARNTATSRPDLYLSGGTVTSSHNLIGDGTGQTVLVHGTDGNLVGTATAPVDPLFVDLSGTDSSRWNLRLQPTSPAVDAGDTAALPAGLTRDLDGGPRVRSSAVDIGAYELSSPPADLSLSSLSIYEKQPIGSAVGFFSASDPDPGETFTYTLVDGTGADGNSAFAVVDNELRTAAVLDYTVQNSYSIRIRVTDSAGLYLEKVFTIAVVRPNQVPTDIAISNTTIPENQPAGTVVGMLSGTDPDPGQDDTLVFSLAEGFGDNAAFTIAGRELRTAFAFDYETKSTYLIRLRATDIGGLSMEKTFVITVTDVDEIAPTISATSINDGAAQRSTVKKLSVTFSEPVILSPGAVAVKLKSGSLPPNTTITLTNPSADQQTYLLTFSGIGAIAGSLADGIYDLTISAAGVQDLAGNPLTADYTQRFHRLFGDVDGNKVVNALDYAKLKATYGRSSADPLFNPALDYEGNNVINALDLAQFRKRYGLLFSY